VPATVGLVVLAKPIVALIFEHGAFTEAHTAATAAALAFYAPGLVGYSAVKIAVPAFYSLRESRTPVVVSAVTVLLNVALNVSLVRAMGFTGLALGTAVSAIFNASALLWLLRGRLGGLDGRRITASLVRIGAASAVMGLAVWATDTALATWSPARSMSVMALRVASSIVVGLLVLDASARVMHAQEFIEARAMVLRRLRLSARRR
jgi:putative peptidoglycan lipid II flippase